jgi:hypothetical protein
MKRLALVLLLVGGTAAAQMPGSNTPNCSLRLLRGTYVVSYQGWLYFPAGDGYPEMQVPGVILGVRSISGTGAITGDATVILPFGKSVYETTEGSLATINEDCTGTLTRFSRVKGSSDPPSKEVDRFVFLRDTGELVVIKEELEWGTIPMVLGSWKRMASLPDQAQWEVRNDRSRGGKEKPIV